MGNDMNTTVIVDIVTIILAIGAVLVPCIMAYLVLQMTKYFTPKTEFAALKEQLAREHIENKGAIDELRHDIKSLLKR
jgi:hypothetical protein